ncbi:hypothetical protein BofuT4_uP052200.1 [Botrytis cinerea T4]|uniref:Uncharacterized protein n=1 Tax=Botryotinia fuckeliana (strain T4) TaxID=999810 RepID=G2XWK1_BOTF4|nr:hypothetical protein BofuT4_uP052200.1 [Botrytis cinerea T4]
MNRGIQDALSKGFPSSWEGASDDGDGGGDGDGGDGDVMKDLKS